MYPSARIIAVYTIAYISISMHNKDGVIWTLKLRITHCNVSYRWPSNWLHSSSGLLNDMLMLVTIMLLLLCSGFQKKPISSVAYKVLVLYTVQYTAHSAQYGWRYWQRSLHHHHCISIFCTVYSTVYYCTYQLLDSGIDSAGNYLKLLRGYRGYRLKRMHG